MFLLVLELHWMIGLFITMTLKILKVSKYIKIEFIKKIYFSMVLQHSGSLFYPLIFLGVMPLSVLYPTNINICSTNTNLEGKPEFIYIYIYDCYINVVNSMLYYITKFVVDVSASPVAHDQCLIQSNDYSQSK